MKLKEKFRQVGTDKRFVRASAEKYSKFAWDG
jgi:hypothetical protein